MLKSNYAAKAETGENPAFTFEANLLRAVVVFPFKDGCVDHGSHKHLPDSSQSLTNSPNRNQD